MCGLIGVWGPVDREVAERMLGHLRHRGPDAEGWFRHPGGRFLVGHRRLSIMDPTGGNQPIHRLADRSAIVANGEIYNYPRLRGALGVRNVFTTGSDSEAILHLYAERGVDAVTALDGMFAFVIVDGDHLFAARDPLGIKPLYVGRREGAWCFGSELKALAGYAQDVREFPPGTFFRSDRGFERFYEVPDRAPEPASLEAHACRVRSTLEQAVVKRLMSDVPLGAFLSGGLDSSIIAALARRHMDTLHTFSVGVEGSSDLEAARLVAKHLDTVHHEYVFSRDEVAELLPRVVRGLESFDQDLVRSAVPCFLVARLAAEHVKVVLTGEGADELFAGYTYYKEIEDPAALHQELRRSVCSLHDINLQRVDRMTMAHGLEARVPFLDLDMIECAQQIPVEQKLWGANGRRVEKYVLRKACEDLLPPGILWRDKEQFDEGSGSVDVLGASLEQFMSADEAGAYRAAHSEAGLRSAEEAVYHKLLVDACDSPEAVLRNVARWADRP